LPVLPIPEIPTAPDFDAPLVAQAKLVGLTIVSHDGQLDAYGIHRVSQAESIRESPRAKVVHEQNR
jgi:hypothetical protein